MTALALVFYLTGAVVVLVHPDERNLMFGLTALAQTTHLLLIGLDTLPGFDFPDAAGHRSICGCACRATSSRVPPACTRSACIHGGCRSRA